MYNSLYVSCFFSWLAYLSRRKRTQIWGTIIVYYHNGAHPSVLHKTKHTNGVIEAPPGLNWQTSHHWMTTNLLHVICEHMDLNWCILICFTCNQFQKCGGELVKRGGASLHRRRWRRLKRVVEISAMTIVMLITMLLCVDPFLFS